MKNTFYFACLVILAFTSLTNAQDRFAVRVTSFPNTVNILDVKIINGTPQAKVLSANSCLTADCSSKYNLAADLTTVNDRIMDFAINNLMQSPTPKISGVCSQISTETPDLSIQSQ